MLNHEAQKGNIHSKEHINGPKAVNSKTMIQDRFTVLLITSISLCLLNVLIVRNGLIFLLQLYLDNMVGDDSESTFSE